MKAEKDSIFLGQFIPAGQEFPPEHAELSKGKTRRHTAPAATMNPEQTDRPGFSGSGEQQREDIVTDRGHITQPSKDKDKDKDKDKEPAKKPPEGPKAP